MTPEPPPERYPFWGYSDLMVFAGLTIPCMVLGLGVTKMAFWILRLHPAIQTWDLLFSQFAGYALLFAALFGILRLQYDRPFWASLAWNPGTVPLLQVALAGVAAVIVIGALGLGMRLPPENPMLDLLKDPTSIALIALFGVTLGPLCEEVVFRGFLQPLTVRSLGVAPGILAAALPFGILHYWEYGKSWKHVVLISLAGAAFGWMRQRSGSTRAATIMHGVYNGVQFAAFLAQR